MSSRGFTLLELLVVLSIAALVVVIAVPRFHQAVPGTRLKAAALALAESMREARSTAIRENDRSGVVLDVNSGHFAVMGTNEIQRLPNSLQLSLVTAKSEILSDGLAAIRFYPDGSSSGGRVTLADGERSYDVEVDWFTGKATIRAP